MSLPVQTDNKKPRISLTDDVKNSDSTWSQHVEQWANTGSRMWAAAGTPITTENKNTRISLTDNVKN